MNFGRPPRQYSRHIAAHQKSGGSRSMRNSELIRPASLASSSKLQQSPSEGRVSRSVSMAESSERSTRDGGDARWWMGCQHHICALREAMHAATANRDVELLLKKCVSVYLAAIRSNSSLDDEKILIALSAMEAAFTWLGGWRPSSAILLVHSLMGVQLEDEICNSRLGLRDETNTTSVLSHYQITNLTNIQKTTRGVERKLSKKLAYIQMLLSDQDVLVAAVKSQIEFEPTSTTMPSSSSASSRSSPTSSSSSSSSSSPSSFKTKADLRTILRPRMSRLKKLLLEADQLRLTTLHQLFLVLTPVQVARCAAAAFELAFMMRELGNAARRSILRAPIHSARRSVPEVATDGAANSELPVADSRNCCAIQKTARKADEDLDCQDD